MRCKYTVSGIENFDLELPVISTGPKSGARVLVVSDWTSPSEKSYLDGGVGTVLKNAINFAVGRCKSPNTGKWGFLNFYPFSFRDYLALPDGARQTVYKSCVKRMTKYVEKVQPDLVVFSGDFAKMFDTSYTIDQLPLKNKSKIGVAELNGLQGRFLPIKIGSHACTAMHTFSFRSICSPYGENIDLLGFLIRHLEVVLHGKNRYTLPRLPPKGDWYNTITNRDQFDTFYEKLTSADVVCFDTEARNLNKRYDNTLLSMQFGFDGATGWVLPWEHRQSPFSIKDRKYMQKKLVHYFEQGRSKYHVMHNGQFDIRILRSFLDVQWYNHDLADTQAFEYFLDENRRNLVNVGKRGPFGLGSLSLEYGGLAYLDTTLGKKDRSNMSATNLDDLCEYGAVDTIYPLGIANFCQKEAKRLGLGDQYLTTVTKLGGVSTLAFVEMEHNGIPIDKEYLQKMTKPSSPLVQGINEAKTAFRQLPTVIDINEKLAYEKGFKSSTGLFGKVATPWVFDINKKAHAHTLFFDTLHLEPKSFGKTGLPAVDSGFISAYKDVCVEAKLLGDLRKQEKVYNTNIVGYLKYITDDSFADTATDCRIRSTYSYHIIVTCRTSSQNPNQQNIPARGPYAKHIKKQFRARKGYVLLDYDLNANEVKNWGNVAQDSKIADSFKPGMLLRRGLRIWAHKKPKTARLLAEFLEKEKWFEKDGPDGAQKQALCKKNPHLKTPLKMLIELEIGGDVHRRNFSFFFGIPANKVTPEQRQSVKSIVFGVLYGKGPAALAIDVMTQADKEHLEEISKKVKAIEAELAARGIPLNDDGCPYLCDK